MTSKTLLTESLPVDLSPSDLNVKGTELATLVTTISVLEESKRANAAAIKAQIDELNPKVKQLCREIATRTEYREVEIEHVPDTTRKVFDTYRKDTGARIGQRAMTSSELQVSLELGGEN